MRVGFLFGVAVICAAIGSMEVGTAINEMDQATQQSAAVVGAAAGATRNVGLDGVAMVALIGNSVTARRLVSRSRGVQPVCVASATRARIVNGAAIGWGSDSPRVA